MSYLHWSKGPPEALAWSTESESEDTETKAATQRDRHTKVTTKISLRSWALMLEKTAKLWSMETAYTFDQDYNSPDQRVKSSWRGSYCMWNSDGRFVPRLKTFFPPNLFTGHLSLVGFTAFQTGLTLCNFRPNFETNLIARLFFSRAKFVLLHVSLSCSVWVATSRDRQLTMNVWLTIARSRDLKHVLYFVVTCRVLNGADLRDGGKEAAGVSERSRWVSVNAQKSSKVWWKPAVKHARLGITCF